MAINDKIIRFKTKILIISNKPKCFILFIKKQTNKFKENQSSKRAVSYVEKCCINIVCCRNLGICSEKNKKI